MSFSKDKLIPHSRPFLGKEEADRVTGVIASGLIAQGRCVHEFEEAFCKKMNFKNAALTTSGTVSLHLILAALGVGCQDEVIIPSYVCTSLLHAVRYVGATPIVADVDPNTGNIDPADVKNKLSPRTRAIIVPHMFGLSADMDRLMTFKVPIVEDCAQAVGSTFKGKPVGSYGIAAIFSFYATKVMTTGEGGAIVSDSNELMDRVRDLRFYDQKDDDKMRFNYKMTDIQAAIGIVQLDRLDYFIDRRRGIASKYNKAFKTLDLRLPISDPSHIYFRYAIDLGEHKDSGKMMDILRDKGVQCARPVFRPLHRYLGLSGYPKAEGLWRRLISIPIYPLLTDEEVDFIIQAVMEAYDITQAVSEERHVF
jgi:perosamine synthetase